MNKGGARLLANIASKTNDPQTLRMVAGALANLCGNGTTCLYCIHYSKIFLLIWNFNFLERQWVSYFYSNFNFNFNE